MPLPVPNFAMFRRGLLRLLRGSGADLRALASRSWDLCGTERVQVAPAIYLPGALDKIKALSPWQTWEREHVLIHGGEVEHAPSSAHLLENVQLVDACLYKGAARQQVGFGTERPLRTWQPTRLLNQARLITGQTGSHFFGNLLLDDFPLALLAADGPPPLSMVRKPYSHEADYRRLLHLPDPEPETQARIKQLLIHTDFAQNSLKLARYEQLRSALRKTLGQDAGSRPKIYLRRGGDGEARILANEQALLPIMAAAGIELVDPDVLDAATIARRTLDATLVVGVEGSHLSHVIYSMAADATLLVLQPPTRFAMPYKEYTDRMQMRFAFLVGDEAAQGFEIAADDLQRMLELLL